MQRALATLHPSRFDVILLTPPPSTTFDELAALDLGRAAATPGFVWLWVGSGQTGAGAGAAGSGEEGNVGGGVGLEKGRELLNLWGYRRCEDIVWLKTNKRDPEGDLAKEVRCLSCLFPSSRRAHLSLSIAFVPVHFDSRALPDGHSRNGETVDGQQHRSL